MRKLIVFNQISLDGYFCDAQGDMSWAHRSDPEWAAYGADNASGTSVLLFGRRTYELMASVWPSAMAKHSSPVIAEHMNSQPKVVFSRTLTAPTWNNTTVRAGDAAEIVADLKREPGPDLVLMGSGTLLAQLVGANLVDQLILVVVPVALGAGRSLFEGARARASFRPTQTRTFENGNVVLTYAPA